MDKNKERRPRIVYPNDILPDENNLSELTSSEEKEEIERLFGYKQDPN